jgi:hypothetical protein
MFLPSVPVLTAELMRSSEFERDAASKTGDVHAGETRLAGLSPTLMQDLQRHDPSGGPGLDLLQVLAAAVRHNRNLLVHLELDYRIIPLTVWPLEGVVHSPLTAAQFLDLRLPDLRVLRVGPPKAATGRDSGPSDSAAPLNLLLWELALRGGRETLLPEIAGPAAYRVSPGADLAVLALAGTMAAGVARLRRQITPLRDIAAWPGFDRDRAIRMLNGLYLQAALMVSRSHPAALGGP